MRAPAGLPSGRITSEGIAAVLTALLPEQAIVVDESISTGHAFDAPTAGAPPHDWLNIMGGSIGFGLPAATGAAIAAPDRPVVLLQADGSAMYTLQALWTMVREGLNVKTLLFAIAVALLPVANALRDIPRRASRTSVELQGLVQMFVLMLVIEIASLIGNYY